MMQISFIGLGTMGGPAALNLIKGGHKLTVCDLNPERAKEHLALGAIWAETPADAAKDAEAQNMLGIFYSSNEGYPPQDFKTAVKWWTLAAEQGETSAQVNLASLYYKGQGVPQDYVYSHMWYNLANANGADASEKRKLVEEKMTPAQIEQAQALARECLKKEYKDC